MGSDPQTTQQVFPSKHLKYIHLIGKMKRKNQNSAVFSIEERTPQIKLKKIEEVKIKFQNYT